MRNAYGKALLELGGENDRIVVLEADLSKATKTSLFAGKYPDRFFNIGIAEQNMMSMAAGFASCGKIPFATALAVFASMRACEQVRTSICIGRLNVKIGAPYGGLCTAENGPTHQCVEDIGIMRSIPNMTVLAPADDVSCRAAVRWAAEYDGPVYIRILRDDEPVIFADGKDVDITTGNILRHGGDIAVCTHGITAHMALKAADLLARQGIDASVCNFICLKPLPENTVIALARKCKKIVVAEEHNIHGGLASAVAEITSRLFPVPVIPIAVNDFFSDSADHATLLKKAGITVENIVNTARNLCGKTERK